MSLLSCSDQDNIKPDLPEFQNHSFDAPTIYPWMQSGVGQGWMYDARYCECLLGLGENQTAIIQQNGFPSGSYTIELHVLNNNPVADIQDNGILRIYIDGVEVDFKYLHQGYQTVTTSFQITNDNSSIGFSAGHIGPSGGRVGNLNISVNSVSIVNYKQL